MIRPLSLLLSFLATQSCVQAYSTLLPQRSSYFVGRSVQGTSPVNPAIHRGNHGTSATLTMKKGKANVPPQMRSQYARAQEMESYRKQMIESQRVGKDGLPVFNLYVRTGLKNVSFVGLCVSCFCWSANSFLRSLLCVESSSFMGPLLRQNGESFPNRNMRFQKPLRESFSRRESFNWSRLRGSNDAELWKLNFFSCVFPRGV